jgi:hypothetical protein
MLGEEVKVSKTLSPLPNSNPPPFPSLAALFAQPPGCPSFPPITCDQPSSAYARTIELLDRMNLLEHIPQFMCVFFSMTLLFECAAFLPYPRSHAFRRRTQKITDSTVGDISLESLKELGMTSVQALVFKKEQQRHFAPPPTCACTLRCLIILFFQMLCRFRSLHGASVRHGCSRRNQQSISRCVRLQRADNWSVHI